MELQKMKFSSGRKPPLHPGPQWWDRRWIAKQLRSNKSYNIKSTFLGFLMLVKFDYKLEIVDLSYDFELLLDLAELVLTKYHSNTHEHHSSLFPKDTKLPFYHIKLMGKIFSEQVQFACAYKVAWWPFDFTSYLVRLVLKKLRPKPRLCVDHFWWPFDFTSYLVRLALNKLCPDTKKLERLPRLCVDHGPLPVDVVAKKRSPPVFEIHRDDPKEIDDADHTPSASKEKLKGPFVDHDVDALPFKKLKIS